MISLSCEHPDLLEFIDVKAHDGAVTKANISVRVTDDFMEAVQQDAEWTMSFTRNETGETITKTAPARQIFDRLCENNWDWAEPGILFWDSIEQWNLLSNNTKFQYAGVNPCAEEPLPAGGSCLLGSINLAEFVTCEKLFDFTSFKRAVHIAVKYLNDILDEGLPLHPLEEQRKSVADWRQIGLGIMGLADMLIKMEIPYGGDYAVDMCDKISMVMADTAIQTSAYLAADYGVYPMYYHGDVTATRFFQRNASPDTVGAVKAYGLRNSQLLTIAPTGTISTMLGISGGIEPIFANSYTRKTESLHGEDVYYKVYTPIVEQYMQEHGLKEEEELPAWFVTSTTVAPIDRIRMQAAWQNSIDASISSTVNLPNSATVDDVKKIYTAAWQCGLKGITIFRDGCQRASILITDNSKTDSPDDDAAPVVKTENTTLGRGDIIQCDDNLIGKKRKLTTGCGSLHVGAYFDPVTGDLQEVYLNKGSTGGCANFMTGLSRMISLACRAGVSVSDIKDQLDSTGTCPSYATRRAVVGDTSKGSCCPMAIGNALMEMQEEMKADVLWVEDDVDDVPPWVPAEPKQQAPTCPECGEPIVFEGGCQSCKACGWSKCG